MTLEDMQTITALLEKVISHQQIMAVLTEIKQDVAEIKARQGKEGVTQAELDKVVADIKASTTAIQPLH